MRAASSILGCLLKLLCHLASFLAFYPLSFMQICANVFIAWKFIIRSKLPYPPFSQSFPTQSNLSCFSCLCLSLSLGLCWHCFLLECSCHNLWQLSAFMWQAMCPNYSRSFPPPAFSPSTLQQLWCIWFADWPSATAVKAAVALSLSLSRLLSIICKLCRITTTIAAAAAVVAVCLLWPAATTVTLGERVHLLCYTLKTLYAAFGSV